MLSARHVLLECARPSRQRLGTSETHLISEWRRPTAASIKRNRRRSFLAATGAPRFHLSATDWRRKEPSNNLTLELHRNVCATCFTNFPTLRLLYIPPPLPVMHGTTLLLGKTTGSWRNWRHGRYRSRYLFGLIHWHLDTFVFSCWIKDNYFPVRKGGVSTALRPDRLPD